MHNHSMRAFPYTYHAWSTYNIPESTGEQSYTLLYVEQYFTPGIQHCKIMTTPMLLRLIEVNFNSDIGLSFIFKAQRSISPEPTYDANYMRKKDSFHFDES